MNDFLKIPNLNYYNFNPLASTPLIIATLAFISFFISFHLEKKSDLNRALSVFFLSTSSWFYGMGFMANCPLTRVMCIWASMMYLGIVLTPVSIFQVSSVVANRQKRQQLFLVVLYGLSLLVFVWKVQGQDELFTNGILIFSSCVYLLSMTNFIHRLRHSSDPQEQTKIRFFIFGFLIFLLGYTDLGAVDTHTPTVAYITVFGVVVGLLSFVVQEHIKMVEQCARKLEDEIAQKAVEISRIVAELRATQLKLFETGKISAVASLSAGILHQISQPITAIHGFVKFIKKEMKNDNPFYRPICLMEEQSQYLKEMLADLMELIRHREIRKENIDVNACIRRALNLLTDELRIRRVNWDLFLEEHLPLVHADSVHLQQVFMNVVINAIQALSLLPRGAVRYIKITSEFDKAKNQVRLSFQDTGPGVSPETQKQIFEPFFSTKTTGAGIGLALCKDLIAEHEGTIDVVSPPGQGATFIITLPCASTVVTEQVK